MKTNHNIAQLTMDLAELEDLQKRKGDEIDCSDEILAIERLIRDVSYSGLRG